ncbi:FAD-dependent monooxygenase [Mycolicibacterium diernhoferi]|uniref:Pentachlorophenol monooxygenase n=1 Tax=Mycolicibacterium diernhoferi TaxID=1801 RepID=A0A1Q4HHM1_9MYCO|nr:FAD-dependent monooxygenase [Mycolicibacterium diernhoferi]OJZ66993.1 pentachlorophenol monooxygenase [Mycolicibacterium diernhoferi]OPE54229.1 pentachlorophenol monooxygenase [Mycolicibacterium diernhoferi]PEG52494.1 pentachlorophenol monooxygenase [Mycolicibacterium diernhoferi]QYL23183.1 FAD-dependent monooxygenase [Mycolicibacterium diernhoferi]
MTDTDVLIAGAGPIGLTAAIELARRGIAVRIVDPLREPPQYAKAVGVQPRTLEVFERMGVLRQILDAAVPFRGQLVYVNGEKVTQLELALPEDVPFGFIGLPQYATEAILRAELTTRNVPIERGVRLGAFEQDTDGVTATLTAQDGTEQTVRARYLLGADGAHSIVRKTLGLTFEGAAFEEQYMLGDVEVDWSLPHDYNVRVMHQTDGVVDDLLVAIPLPGRGRYRMSMLVPEELKADSDGTVQHGFSEGGKPELHHIQTVLDRMSPEPAVARNLRWSSVFRISHRIVDAYGRGRVFVAGDAAHIHPPTGAQGMNTGIQDAHNLAWKLALAATGNGADGLLGSYDAERRPVGEEVVGRTVRSARHGIGADSEDPAFVIRREAQLLISYAGSPIVADGAGGRAPDARGLVRPAVADPVRLYTLLAGTRHTLLLYADAATGFESLEAVATAAVQAAHGLLDVYVVAHPDADVDATVLPLVRDTDGDFAKAYRVDGAAAFVVRPDGYLGYVGAAESAALVEHLRRTFR